MKKIISLLIVIILSFLFGKNIPTNKQKLQNAPSITIASQQNSSQNSSFVKVIRVIDGDTIEIEGKQTVRYIGIDTPELHNPKKSVQCFGKEAYEKNKGLIEGKMVKLEKDVSEKDRYGRLLRYVLLYDPPSTPEALFINKYLVTEGYAHAATFPPDVKYADLFINEQRTAVLNKKGLWNSCYN